MSKILIVDDEPRILLLLQSLLKANGYDVETARDGNAALDAVRKGGVDIAVTDLRMTPMDGMMLFREIRAIAPAMPVILLTAYASVETAIEAMKSGIFDYLTKPFKVDDMIACLKRAEEQIAKAATTAAQPDRPARYRFENLIASSPLMVSVCETIQKVAPTAATVLINGESGTGKEVIARTIHRNSTRAGKPWVAVNCAAIPENLLESEMFGHVKGSFTGAVADKEGLFEAANGGTLFLDEISSMPLILQGKLLRVLQEKEIRRVGGTRSIPVDVRVIAASNSNLEEAVVKGTFRSDLYYRFAVITIDIPPLRKRPEDIVPLAQHFIRNELGPGKPVPEIAPDAVRLLEAYDWPGNVRELENAIKHALTFHQGGEITKDLLPQKLLDAPIPKVAPGESNASLKSFLKQKEKEYIEQILSTTGGDKEKAAETLKVNLSTLYRKLSDG
ncbi:MAG: sigma-54-dependent Fis family transcriptional regulator [Kiritimatiellae bacterium]|nr:sigma-54-dependent Fis family transcriptional regulator [Kiritimatiellia bacterium]